MRATAEQQDNALGCALAARKEEMCEAEARREVAAKLFARGCATSQYLRTPYS